MKRATILLTLYAVAACGPREPGEEPGAARLRLCVENAAPANGNLVARAGLVRFDVMPGETVCKPITLTGGDVPLTARSTGGGLAGPQSYSARLQPGVTACWRWRLTSASASAADLVPCPDEDEAPADSAR